MFSADSIVAIISFLMLFVKMFVADVARRQAIEDNLYDWMQDRLGKGSETSDQVSDLDKQDQELDKDQGNDPYKK